MTSTERTQHDEQTRIRRTLMAADPTTRTLTERERFLLAHVSMFGSAGYPVAKCGRRWMVTDLPGVDATKRAAVARFEAYYEVLVDLSVVERMKAVA